MLRQPNYFRKLMTSVSPLLIPLLFVALLASLQPSSALAAEPIRIATVSRTGPVAFQQDILPILRSNCLSCHNQTDAEAELVLETPQAMLAGGDSGPAVVAGKSDQSLLLKVASHNGKPVMPPAANKVGARNLTPEELGLIKLWIDGGAQASPSDSDAKVEWQRLPAAFRGIFASAISPVGDTIAVGRGNRLFLYHLGTRQLITELADPDLSAGDLYGSTAPAHLDVVQSLAFSPNGQQLASGGYRNAKIWQWQPASASGKLAEVNQPISALAVSADHQLTAVGEASGTIGLYETASGKLLHRWQDQNIAITAVAFTADATRLAAADANGAVRMFVVADRSLAGSLKTPNRAVAIAFVAGDQQLAVAGEDHVIRILAMPKPAEAASAPAEPPAAETPAAEAPGTETPPAKAPAAGDVPIRELRGHGGLITALRPLGAAQAQLVSASHDKTVRIWNVESGASVRQLNTGGQALGMAVSPDAKTIISIGDDRRALIWNAENGQQLVALRTGERARSDVDAATRQIEIAKQVHDGAKRDLEEAKKHKKAEEDSAKKSAETRTKAEEESKKKTAAAVKPLADKQAADTGLQQAQAAVTPAEEAKRLADEKVTKATASLEQARADLAAAEDKTAATAKQQEADRLLKEAQQAQREADQKLNQAKAAVKKAEGDVQRLAAPAKKAEEEKATAERNFQAAVRSVERSVPAVQRATKAAETAQQQVTQREAAQKAATVRLEQVKQAATAAEHGLVAVAMAHDGASFALADDQGQVTICGRATGALLEQFSVAQDARPIRIAFGPDRRLLTAAAAAVEIWQQGTWRLQRTIGSVAGDSPLVDRVTAVAFSPDGKLLATGGGEASRSGELKLWNSQTGDLVREIPDAHSDSVFGLDFSLDGKYLASCSADRFMKIFQVQDGKWLKSFEGHSHHVTGVSWRADGRTLATCGADQAIKVWDFQSGTQKKTITDFKKEATGIRFLGTSDKFVVSGGDRAVRTKDVNGGGGVNFAGAADFVYTVCASADGKTIAAGGQDGVLRVWQSDGKALATFDPPPLAQDESDPAPDK